MTDRDLVKDLRTVSGMIMMGERIAFGRETSLMDEAADAIERLAHPFRNADEKDWEHLFKMLPNSGHGQFWKAVMSEMRAALSGASAAIMTPSITEPSSQPAAAGEGVDTPSRE